MLVRTGDILLDVNNPGIWMAHCHIAEHHESGMMFQLHRDRGRPRRSQVKWPADEEAPAVSGELPRRL